MSEVALCSAPTSPSILKEPRSAFDWFEQARYGMFVHWGAYSVDGRGEWVANRERLSLEEYTRDYAERFTAEAYDPAAWAALARDAGMGYVILTTRHHDGFSLWPTATSKFHAGQMGPKRDLLGPFVKAIRAAGLKVGFYFSPADWYHPDYPGPHFRDWPCEDDWASPEARERFIAYYRAQLRELLTQYGKIDYLWYDGCIPDDLQSPEVNEEMLSLQPHLLINERNGPPSHVKISEQIVRAAEPGGIWEACLTLNCSWGWHGGDVCWKTSADAIRLLIETAGKAGNLLLNVGPSADGVIPEESVRILREAGNWLLRNGESIYGSSRSPFSWQNWGGITTRGSKVYLHVWRHRGTELRFAELKNRVRSAYLLDGGKPLSFVQCDGLVLLNGLPEILDPIATTIVLDVEGEPQPITPQTSFWIPS
jgi:alpha-L-fucosidase